LCWSDGSRVVFSSAGVVRGQGNKGSSSIISQPWLDVGLRSILTGNFIFIDVIIYSKLQHTLQYTQSFNNPKLWKTWTQRIGKMTSQIWDDLFWPDKPKTASGFISSYSWWKKWRNVLVSTGTDICCQCNTKIKEDKTSIAKCRHIVVESLSPKCQKSTW
jgi:hypothetical protein